MQNQELIKDLSVKPLLEELVSTEDYLVRTELEDTIVKFGYIAADAIIEHLHQYEYNQNLEIVLSQIGETAVDCIANRMLQGNGSRHLQSILIRMGDCVVKPIVNKLFEQRYDPDTEIDHCTSSLIRVLQEYKAATMDYIDQYLNEKTLLSNSEAVCLYTILDNINNCDEVVKLLDKDLCVNAKNAVEQTLKEDTLLAEQALIRFMAATQNPSSRYRAANILDSIGGVKISDVIEELHKEPEEEPDFVYKDLDNLSWKELEDFLEWIYKQQGYLVERTSNKDQGADLVITKYGVERTAVQVKHYDSGQKVTNKAVQEVVAAKKHCHCTRTMVISSQTYTDSAIELANSNDVVLQGRKQLKNLIDSYRNSV
jgi:hypothetical protein